MIAAAPAARAGAARSRLHLGRVDLLVRSAARATDWPAQWADVDRFRRENADALAEALAPLLDDSDPSVWIIRRLDLSAMIDGGGEVAARSFAAALREAIARALRGEESGGVVRFANRAAYLARLLAEVARGDAFERWYHFRHRHLRALPTLDALVHIVAADPENGLEALAELHATRALGEVIQALGKRGSERVLAVFGRGDRSPGGGSKATGAVTPEAARAAIERWGADARAELALLAGAVRTSALPAPALVASVRTALRHEALRRAASASPAGDTVAELRRARPGTDEAPGAGLRRRRRDPAATPRTPGRHADAGRALLSAPIDTPFAGVFLLWRSVVEIGLDRLLPDGEEGGAARLTLAATLAGRDWRTAFEDSALRWLAGVDDPDVTPARAGRGLAAAFVARMAEYFEPRPQYLAAQRHGAVHVVQDATTEDWLYLFRGRGPRALPPAIPPAEARARPIARDLDYFGVDAAMPAGRFPWILLARAAYADFGRRLLGLERSSAAWLASNLIAGEGRVEFDDVAEVHLPRAQLDLVLRMTGIDGTLVTPACGPAFRVCLPGPG